MQQYPFSFLWHREVDTLQVVFVLVVLLLMLGIQPAFCQSVTLAPDEGVPEPLQLAQEQPENTHNAGPLAVTLPTIPAILTTRPSFTDSWLTIPQGSLQIENGTTYTNNSNRTRSVILPESLIKLGLSDQNELRFSVPNYTYLHHDDDGQLANNFGDITVGISHHVALPGKVDLAIIPFLNIPTGANKASSNALDPQLRLVAAKWLTPKLVVASQFDTRWNTGKSALSNVVMHPTAIVYYSFTDKLSGFLEYGGFLPTTGKSTHYIQGGALYLLTKRQQIDARIGTGLNRTSSDLILGFGYSLRIDGLLGKSKDYATVP